MQKTVFAYTPPGNSPPYISITDRDGKVTADVRSPLTLMTEERRQQLLGWLSKAGDEQPHASIEMPFEELMNLAVELTAYLRKEVEERPRPEWVAFRRRMREALRG